MSSLHVELVAADRLVWEGEANQVSARTIEGDLGVLPGHEPYLGVLIEGAVRIHDESTVRTAEVDGGFLSIDHDHVTIVAEVVDGSGMGL